MRSTIKEVKFPKSDSRGNSCLLVLSDKTEGWFNYKGDMPYAIGEEVEYSTTQKPKASKPGEFNTILTVSKIGSAPQSKTPIPSSAPNAPQRPQINVGAGKSANEMKAEASTQILCTIMKAFYDGKLESAQIATQLQEYDRLVWSEINEVYGK